MMLTKTTRLEDVLNFQSRLLLAGESVVDTDLLEVRGEMDAESLFGFQPMREPPMPRLKSPLSRMKRWWSSRPSSMQLAS